MAKTLDIIRLLPVSNKLARDGSRAYHACHIASILGPCSGVGSKEATALDHTEYPWEVFWDAENSPHGCILTRHGVYVSQELDMGPTYAIIGYCAYQGIPWFTDDTLLELEQAKGKTKQ
jgi:hypothetical protein